jgi:predicted deacylase
VIPIPSCAVCVAPVDGRPRLLVDPGTPVEAGQVVALVDTDGRSEPVRAPVRGRLGGRLFARAVTRGEAVLWLSR